MTEGGWCNTDPRATSPRWGSSPHSLCVNKCTFISVSLAQSRLLHIRGDGHVLFNIMPGSGDVLGGGEGRGGKEGGRQGGRKEGTRREAWGRREGVLPQDWTHAFPCARTALPSSLASTFSSISSQYLSPPQRLSVTISLQ